MIKGIASLAAVAFAAAAVWVAASPASPTMAHPKLIGTVGPGFTITLKKPGGGKVTKLSAGKYTFVISDKSPIHNFALQKGASFHKALTTVSFVGSKTVTVSLGKGKWVYLCDPHATTMKGAFTVS